MDIRAAEAERADTAAARPVDLRPRLVRRWNEQRHLLPVDSRVALLAMKVCWNLAVLQCQHELDEAGNAGSGFQMADVRLHCAERKWTAWLFTEHFCNGAAFDGISERCS